jgi:hypothetical protein
LKLINGAARGRRALVLDHMLLDGGLVLAAVYRRRVAATGFVLLDRGFEIRSARLDIAAAATLACAAILGLGWPDTPGDLLLLCLLANRRLVLATRRVLADASELGCLLILDFRGVENLLLGLLVHLHLVETASVGLGDVGRLAGCLGVPGLFLPVLEHLCFILARGVGLDDGARQGRGPPMTQVLLTGRLIAP